MVELILVGARADPPVDDQAIYVWPGVVQPAWGTRAVFERRPRVGVTYSEVDWRRAIGRAQMDASRAGYSKIYVVGRSRG